MSILEKPPLNRIDRFSIDRIPDERDKIRIFPQTQAGIYTLPFTRQQLLNPRPTPTDPNNLMDRLNALYTRTITPYIMPKEEGTGDGGTGGGTGDGGTGGGTGGGGTGGGGTGGGGTGGGGGGGDIIIDDIIIDEMRRRRLPPDEIPPIVPPRIPPRDLPPMVPPLDDRFRLLEDQIADLRDNPFSPPPFDPSILENDIASLREQIAGIPALIPDVPTPFDPTTLQQQIDMLNQRDMIQVPPPFDPRNLQSQIDNLSLGLGDLTRNISDDRLSLMDSILDEVDSRFSPQRLGMGMGRVS